jgi:hypothetical protein
LRGLVLRIEEISNDSIVSTAIAGAAVANAAAVISQPAFATPDDSALVELEEQIFEQYEAAHAHDDEILRLHAIWYDEATRLHNEALGEMLKGRTPLTSKQRWDLVTAMPESKEHTRLVELGEPFFARMDVLVKQMFAIPAHTADGCRAKATVLISCVMGSEWTKTDKEADYDVEMGRKLLIEFVGGEPGEMLRDQFA